jgi:hypothetical protein
MNIGVLDSRWGPQEGANAVDEISITIAFVLLGLTWLTLRGMDSRESRKSRR